ncbi:MAG: energy-coupling factor transporter ATPase [Halanaerobium sp.]|nr:energy-coupling factor transporter ATPase [Halanaerobium sp.]
MSYIEVNEVSFFYSDEEGRPLRALEDINLEIRQGEFVAVLGPNGSGKSTLAKLLNVLLLPDEGQVIVDGMDTRHEENLWPIRQQIGMVFQNPDNQIVATLVEEDVAFGPENLGIPPAEIRTRVKEALEAVGMEGYRSHPPHELSGGQKQRVAIAGILAMKPHCIVFDEATAMLDPIGRKEVMETIQKLNRDEGITTVMITHYMEEAVYADRVVVMDQGKKVIAGTPREVFRQVDLMKEYRLEVPEVTLLSQKLQKAGLQVADDILTIDELVKALCISR